jgi:hypothetical protein
MTKRTPSTTKKGFIAQAAGAGHGSPANGWPEEWMFELIQRAAHQRFEWRDHQPGRELDDWLQAEYETRLQLKYHDKAAEQL